MVGLEVVVALFAMAAVVSALLVGPFARWPWLAALYIPRCVRVPVLFSLATIAMAAGLLAAFADVVGLRNLEPSFERRLINMMCAFVGLLGFRRVHELQQLRGPALSTTRFDAPVLGGRVSLTPERK